MSSLPWSLAGGVWGHGQNGVWGKVRRRQRWIIFRGWFIGWFFYLSFQNVLRADFSICSFCAVLFSRYHGIHGPGHSGCQGEGYQRPGCRMVMGVRSSTGGSSRSSPLVVAHSVRRRIGSGVGSCLGGSCMAGDEDPWTHCEPEVAAQARPGRQGKRPRSDAPRATGYDARVRGMDVSFCQYQRCPSPLSGRTPLAVTK